MNTPLGAKELIKAYFEQLDELFKTPRARRFRLGIDELRPVLPMLTSGDVVLVIGPSHLVEAFHARLLVDFTRTPRRACGLWLTNGATTEDAMRLVLSIESKVAQWRLRLGELTRGEMTSITRAAAAIARSSLRIDDVRIGSRDDRYERIRAWREDYKPSVPALAVLREQAQGRALHTNELRELKQVAVALQVAVVVGSDAYGGPGDADIVIQLSPGELKPCLHGGSSRRDARVEVIEHRRGWRGATTMHLDIEQLTNASPEEHRIDWPEWTPDEAREPLNASPDDED